MKLQLKTIFQEEYSKNFPRVIRAVFNSSFANPVNDGREKISAVLLILIVLATFPVAFAFGQETVEVSSEDWVPVTVVQSPFVEAPTVVAWNTTHECEAFSENEKKDDPGYKSYKKGYDLILDEEWEEAIKQFKTMISSYPKSQYLDDASYWIAYAYKATDVDKAREHYKKFIKAYPKSKYYDDAVADLGDLDGSVVFSTSGDSQVVYFERTANGNGFIYGVGTATTLARQQFDKSRRLLTNQLRGLSGTAPVAWTPMPMLPSHDEKLDSETQLQLDILYALGDKKDDEGSYNALKEIAIDPKEHRTLRFTAMDLLVDFKKHDPLPVFVEIAKRDTSEEIQNMAINYIGSLSNNKNRSVETLSELYTAIPKYRVGQLQTVLSSIAEIGNDKAVEFLGGVARDDKNYDLRRDAVYYLGSIGNDKARTALLEILKVKREK